MKKGILVSTIVGIVFSINSLYAFDLIKSEFLVGLDGGARGGPHRLDRGR